MTDPHPQPVLAPDGHDDTKPAAVVAWLLYLLAIPSANTLAVVGLVIAYVARGRASPVMRSHFDRQIRLFWSVLVWGIALIVLAVVSGVLAWLVLPIPVLIAALIGIVVLHVYFTVVAVFGVLRAIGDRSA